MTSGIQIKAHFFQILNMKTRYSDLRMHTTQKPKHYHSLLSNNIDVGTDVDVST